nr:hypothetical protein Iba_chr06aCG14590 [Ipomoea batatas]
MGGTSSQRGGWWRWCCTAAAVVAELGFPGDATVFFLPQATSATMPSSSLIWTSSVHGCP